MRVTVIAIGGWDALVSGAAQIRIEGLYNVEGVGTVYAGTGRYNAYTTTVQTVRLYPLQMCSSLIW
jgi:hypothetical protein